MRMQLSPSLMKLVKEFTHQSTAFLQQKSILSKIISAVENSEYILKILTLNFCQWSMAFHKEPF